jgi:hypothetical protein
LRATRIPIARGCRCHIWRRWNGTPGAGGGKANAHNQGRTKRTLSVRSSSFLLYPPAKWRVIFCLTVALDRRAGDRYVARDHRGGDLDCLLTGSQFQRQHLMNNLQETLRPIYLTSRPMENTRRCNRPGLNEPCSKCPGIVQTTLALPPMVPCGRVSFARGPAGHQRKEGATAPGSAPLRVYAYWVPNAAATPPITSIGVALIKQSWNSSASGEMPTSGKMSDGF